jgi:hypothetical protein
MPRARHLSALIRARRDPSHKGRRAAAVVDRVVRSQVVVTDDGRSDSRASVFSRPPPEGVRRRLELPSKRSCRMVRPFSHRTFRGFEPDHKLFDISCEEGSEPLVLQG